MDSNNPMIVNADGPVPPPVRPETQRILDGIARRLLDEELAAANQEKGDR
jgi:hypothetical protein